MSLFLSVICLMIRVGVEARGPPLIPLILNELIMNEHFSTGCCELDVCAGRNRNISRNCFHGICAADSNRCRCNKGWKGVNCKTDSSKIFQDIQDIDECASNPCREGATCQNLKGGYHCVCPGYLNLIGKPCVKEWCHERTCGYGQCNADRSLCECDAGYTGQTCQTKIFNCNKTSCLNGVCSRPDYCECETAFTGQKCETEIFNCNKTSCLNGVCSRPDYCECEPAFTGQKCDTEWCHERTCEYGQCNADRSLCECDAGYTGQTCQTKIFNCNKTSCLNGVCSRPDYCECEPAFTGQKCETDLSSTFTVRITGYNGSSLRPGADLNLTCISNLASVDADYTWLWQSQATKDKSVLKRSQELNTKENPAEEPGWYICQAILDSIHTARDSLEVEFDRPHGYFDSLTSDKKPLLLGPMIGVLSMLVILLGFGIVTAMWIVMKRREEKVEPVESNMLDLTSSPHRHHSYRVSSEDTMTGVAVN